MKLTFYCLEMSMIVRIFALLLAMKLNTLNFLYNETYRGTKTKRILGWKF